MRPSLSGERLPEASVKVTFRNEHAKKTLAMKIRVNKEVFDKLASAGGALVQDQSIELDVEYNKNVDASAIGQRTEFRIRRVSGYYMVDELRIWLRKHDMPEGSSQMTDSLPQWRSVRRWPAKCLNSMRLEEQ
jgi:hypothetical protein